MKWLWGHLEGTQTTLRYKRISSKDWGLFQTKGATCTKDSKAKDWGNGV